MPEVTYFSYGSNLHPLCLQARIPSANLIGVGELKGYQLRFHKRGLDGSAKCNAFKTADDADHVFGAIYTIAADDKAALDRHTDEGAGYLWQPLTVQQRGQDIEVYSYLATDSHIDESLQPFEWYKALVRIGATFHGFELSYLLNIQSVEAQADENEARDAEYQGLIQRLHP